MSRLLPCPTCSGSVSEPRVRQCLACRSAHRRARETCPICGGSKTWGANCCWACDQAARGTAKGDWHGVVQSFNPLAFRYELNRGDLEWTPRRLAELSGVSRATIELWLAGNAKPRRVELDAVMKILAFETCQHCKGLGYVDPTQAQLQAINKRITRPVAAPPTRVFASPSSVTVGRLIIDPGIRRVRLDHAAVELTRTESVILTVLARNPDHLLRSEEIAERAGITAGSGTVRTYLGRVKSRLAQIGARSYLVSGRGSGFALSARCESEGRSA